MAEAPLRWRERPVPLPPRAALGLGAVAQALLGRLGRLSAQALGAFEGAAAPGVLVVLGEGALPWVDGVIYLGRDPRAPTLLLPTAQEPEVHPALLSGAVALRLRRPAGCVAVVASPPRLVAIDAPRRLDPRCLAALAAAVS